LSLATLFHHRMQVLAGSQVRTQGGGADYSWDTSGTEYGCSLQPLSAAKRVTMLALDIEGTHTLYYDPSDVTLSESDRIKVNSKTYKILSLKEPDGQRAGFVASAIVTEARL
jgi:hypothetical protein